jgi:hypothetical protein
MLDLSPWKSSLNSELDLDKPKLESGASDS